MNNHKNSRLTPLGRDEMAPVVRAGRLFDPRAVRGLNVSAKIATHGTDCLRADGRARMLRSFATLIGAR